TKGIQTEDKRSTKGIQTEDKRSTKGIQTEDKRSTKGIQTEDKQSTKGIQTEDKRSTKGIQTEDKRSTKGIQTEDKRSTKGIQTEDKELENSKVFLYDSLTGIQKKIIIYLYKSCENTRTRVTNEINIIQIQNSLNLGESSVKTSISRLKDKGCISINSRKDGRGGWCKYELEKSLFQSIEKYEQTFDSDKKPYIYNNSNTNNIDNKERTNDSENIELINQMKREIENLNHQIQNKTNETEKRKHLIESSFSKLDFSELEEFGFKKSHLDQIESFGTVSAEIAQDSINHYAWALHNRKDEMKKYAPEKNRFKGLFGVLRKGNAWVEDGYIDPIDEAVQKSLEAKKKQLEKIKKQKEEVFLIDFNLWKESLSDADLKKINNQIKSKTQGRTSGAMYDAAMKDHFKSNIHTSK
ncbi:hypothetical protein L3V86_08345, partial [Thiotrichales bacterium 19S11-10]|nr:hypothetical protein [Thiotrichales bacterium 19S11-10]